MKTTTKLTLAFIATALLSTAQAQPKASTDTTLERIKATNTVRIGVRQASFPVSFMHYEQPQGLAVDLCLAAVQDFAPGAKVEFFQVDTKDRFTKLNEGVIDMECGATTSTKSRRETHGFSAPYFFAHVVAAVHASNKASSVDDLPESTKVVLTQGSTAKEAVSTSSAFMARRIANKQTVEANTHSEALMSFLAQPTAVLVNDDILLRGLLAQSSKASSVKFLPEQHSIEPYAIVFRKADTALQARVNKTLVRMFQSGEYAMLYEKWFMRPAGPNSVNLKLDMSATLKDQVRTPVLIASN